MRKRSINNAHQASSAVACDSSSSSSLFCFPFFYLLLITWIVLFTLNPTVSGSNSWSIPWLSVVHADGNDGEQKVADNGFSPSTRENMVPSNESTLSEPTQLAIKNKTRGPISVQDLKCRRPLFKEVLRLITLPACRCSSCGACKKRGRGFLPGSNLTRKDACMLVGTAKRHALLHASEGSNEFQQFQDSSDKEEPLPHKGKLNVDKNGVVNYTKRNIHVHLEEQGTHLHVDDYQTKHQIEYSSEQFQDSSYEEEPLPHKGKLNVDRDGVVNYSKENIHVHLEEQGTHLHVDDYQTKHQIEYSSEHHLQDHDKDGGEHHNIVNGDNYEQYQGHTPPPGDGFHNETGSAVTTSDILNKTHLRQEPGDGLYNYAADSKGAKILSSNKEAKGASNILNKDKDKYFRTPCNVETKFVDMELSEETLVVQIVIANHEFYSSNVREFELWGSSTYPTEEWLSLGKFEAENSRVSQTFALREPQSVRYLKLQMLSHFGSDFYCTLSMVEVYGVDAIESFLEDWIAEESGGPGAQTLPSKEENSSVGSKGGSPIHLQSHPLEKDPDPESDIDLMLTQKFESSFTDKIGDVSEGKGRNMEKPQSNHHQTGRLALDAVMKLLMQKVRSLEHRELSLSQQFKELDEKYKEASRAHSKEQLMMTSKLEDVATEIANLNTLLQSTERKWDQERLGLQKDIFNQVKAWNTDLVFLRNELSRTQNKELVALAVSFFSIITVVGIQVTMLCVSLFKPGKRNEILLLSCSRMLWAVPFLSCVLVVFVLSL